MRKVIAFIGVEGSGKGYSCQRLLMTKGFKKTSFANTLRDVAFHTLGMTFEEVMKKYEELKQTELMNGLNFRNILENLGSAIRKYDKDFWAKGVLNFISNTPYNVCIDDLRYPNEYKILKEKETSVLAIEGRVDTVTAAELESAVKQYISMGASVVFECEKLEYISISYGTEAKKVGQEALELAQKSIESYKTLGRERLNSGASWGSSSIGVRQQDRMERSKSSVGYH
mgnify:CR=1 FL=1